MRCRRSCWYSFKAPILMCKNALHHRALVCKMSLKFGMFRNFRDSAKVRHQVCMSFRISAFSAFHFVIQMNKIPSEWVL